MAEGKSASAILVKNPAPPPIGRKGSRKGNTVHEYIIGVYKMQNILLKYQIANIF